MPHGHIEKAAWQLRNAMAPNAQPRFNARTRKLRNEHLQPNVAADLLKDVCVYVRKAIVTEIYVRPRLSGHSVIRVAIQ